MHEWPKVSAIAAISPRAESTLVKSTTTKSKRSKSKVAATCLVVLAADLAVGAGWMMSRRQAADPILSAAEIVDLRFPDDLEVADTAQPLEPTAVEDAVHNDVRGAVALFSPTPMYRDPAVQDPPFQGRSAEAAVAPANTPIELASLPAATAPVQPAAAPAAPVQQGQQAQPPAVAAKLAGVAPHRATNTRPGAVLSDGQIANIKRRLRLTPDQQQMWPAVEVALRNLTYGKKADARQNGGQAVQDALDSDGTEHLTSAAFPLVMSFSDDQKRELHVLAHVAGLEQLVPKF
jgi:hypothetical protein